MFRQINNGKELMLESFDFVITRKNELYLQNGAAYSMQSFFCVLVLLFVKMDFTHNNETPKTNDPHIEQTHT
jgi:hypothetical protein